MAESESERARQGIRACRTAHDELAALVARLDSAGLRAQSGCSEWTVAGVLSHLGSAAEIGLGTLTTGKADRDGMPAIWDRWNAMSPEEQAAEFVISDARLVQALEAVDDEDLRNRKLDVGFLPQPISIGFQTSMRLSEVGLHRWDIDIAFNPGAEVRPYTVPYILDVLPTFAGFFSKPIGQVGLVGVTTSDPDCSYVLELREESATLAEGRALSAPTQAFLPAEALLRLTSGRLAPAHTPPSVTVTGELTLDDLRRAFPGY
ncbi:MAG: maleylpyruvate isomerase N-terminal domain-containing protein [Acidimicrobiaceae bacterium]|nr:maleylpyruvate isomerase N-terminal domain-containing protein [Acidimicrobiaceae bacterium]